MAEYIEIDEEIEEVIKATLPKRSGSGGDKLHHFAHCLWSMARFNYVRDPILFRNVVRRWHELALPKLANKDWKSNWKDFRESYGKFKFTVSDKIIPQLYEKAEKMDPPEFIAEYYPGDKAMAGLTNLCKLLQQNNDPPDHFYLGGKHVGALFNVDKASGLRWLRMLVEDKVLEVVEKAKRGKPHKYRYILD